MKIARRVVGAVKHRIVGPDPSLDERVAQMVAASQALGPVPTMTAPISQACTQAQLDEPTYRDWVDLFGENNPYNRKVWEWAWICEILQRHASRAGQPLDLVGFGVGTEPIVGWLASEGHHVLATDLPSDADEMTRWSTTNQHAADIDGLDPRGMATPQARREQVTFRPVDMRALPSDLGTFDAMWSSCAIEHLGSLDAGLDFVRAALRHCRRGAIAVHTTELNVSDEHRTIDSGHTVLYRRKDLEAFFAELQRDGHHIEATFHLGDSPEDAHVDWPPFSGHHLKIPMDGEATTSFGFVIHVG